MKKNKNKEKNKNKRVHFNEEQLTEKARRSKVKSAEKILEGNSNINLLSNQKKTSIDEYTIIKELGSGSYTKILLAKYNLNENEYALKQIDKKLVDKFEKHYEIHIEKQCLIQLKHPNIVKMNKAFQDDNYLYFALEYCSNRDLGRLINCLGKFNYKLAQFYSAEILSAIIYMHKEGIYHRDIKPENIGLDEFMHLKLFDFATADKINKYFDIKSMRFVPLNKNIVANIENENCENNIVKLEKYHILLLSHLFVGTPEYISPEVLEHNYPLIGPGIDIWALGVMIYLFFTGITPFNAKKESELLENIKNVKYSFDNTDIPDDAKDLISKILVKDPKQRIGYNSKDYSEIKNHPFFKGINFDELEYEAPPVSEIKEILEKVGYKITKSEEKKKEDSKNKTQKDLYEGSKDMDDSDEDDENEIQNKRLSASNLLEMTNPNLKVEVEATSSGKTINENSNSNEDVVLLEEKIEKKSPWFHYNTRILKFFSKGHIDYIDPKTKELKGSIFINSDCHANLVDNNKFEIETLNRTFTFKHKNKRVLKEWVDKINSYSLKYAEKNKKAKEI
jgi:3-phosphoinositide dependent protein kinase-1